MYILFCFLCVLLSFSPFFLLMLLASFLLSGLATFLKLPMKLIMAPHGPPCWVLKNGYTQIASCLHRRGEAGGGGRSILTASGRPNEIPFVIKPWALDNDGRQRVPSVALEIYPHFPRVRYVPCFAPKDFSQLITTHRRSVTTTTTTKTTSPCLPKSHKRQLCWLLCLSSISKIDRL